MCWLVSNFNAGNFLIVKYLLSPQGRLQSFESTGLLSVYEVLQDFVFLGHVWPLV